MNDSTERADHTFLFADLAGFTALTEAHGDEEAAELAADFCDFVRKLLPRYGAEEIKTIGDALMLRCDDPDAAVELGLRIVDEVGARSRFPVVRVGMHTGPAIERHGDWFGNAVNLAARVSGAAGGDEVLLTGATREAASGLAGIELRPHGAQRFKNLKHVVAVYRAVHEGQQSEGLPIDPVCRMTVDPGTSAGSLTYRNRLHYFCSLTCVEAFAASPDDYVGSE
ncbi:MAG: adenylate/guanylate cyclase domain-containing protein [Solirubrobacterales bacterium]